MIETDVLLTKSDVEKKKGKKSKSDKKSKKDKKKNKKHKKESKSKSHKRERESVNDSQSESSSDSDNADDNVRRSIITGKRIKMDRELTIEDRVQEIERAAKRHYMNTQY